MSSASTRWPIIRLQPRGGARTTSTSACQSQWATEGREAQLEIGLRAKEDLVTHYLKSRPPRARADMLNQIADETLDEATLQGSFDAVAARAG